MMRLATCRVRPAVASCNAPRPSFSQCICPLIEKGLFLSFWRLISAWLTVHNWLSHLFFKPVNRKVEPQLVLWLSHQHVPQVCGHHSGAAGFGVWQLFLFFLFILFVLVTVCHAPTAGIKCDPKLELELKYS